ncbi:hypothetical protein EMCRGX_G019406 [Ephydatia muelleri]
MKPLPSEVALLTQGYLTPSITSSPALEGIPLGISARESTKPWWTLPYPQVRARVGERHDDIGIMSLGFPLRVTAGPPFQEGCYLSNRPSCLYATLPVKLVESDEEVEEVNTSERLQPPRHQRSTPPVSHEGSAAPVSSQRSRSRTSVSCRICLETVEQFENSGRQLVATLCGHVFCNVCARNSISRQHACPTCRKKITLKQYHRLFL